VKKARVEEEQDKEDRWLLTYADLITLLMAFFVVMYSLSRVDKAKFEQIAMSLAFVFPTSRSAFVPLPGVGGQKGTEPSSVMRKPSEPPSPPPTEAGKEKTALEKLADQFRDLAQMEGIEGSVSVSATPDGHRVIVRLSESLLFEPGSADLTAQAQALIDKIAKILATANKRVRVEGHTDNVPIHNAQFQSNWELSTARATNVVRFLQEKVGIEPKRLQAIGMSEYHPVATNATAAGQSQKRRIEINLVPETAK
jgi:chemotaxis protein MotB